MWLPEQITGMTRSLSALGSEIAPGELTSPGSALLSAVVKLGACTGSFVSPDGLILTNRHCIFNSIQANSSPEKNLLETGFLASSRKAELPSAPGTRVQVTMEMRDVTDQIIEGLRDSPDGERAAKIESRRGALAAECGGKEPGIQCQVVPFHGGVRYWLIRQLEIRDVRLVAFPHAGIGDFGGEIDNFMWPQQKGDFALLRAYAGVDGKVAEPHPENQPYHPRSSLKIAQSPLAEGDFLLVPGYPVATNRYRLATEVEDSFGWFHPKVIEANEIWLRALDGVRRENAAAAMKYAAFEAQLKNGLKTSQGMVASYAASGVIEKKRREEEALAAWIAQSPQRKALYGDVIEKIRVLLSEQHATRDRDYHHFVTTGKLLTNARQIYRLAREKTKPENERAAGYLPRDLERLRGSFERMPQTFDAKVDQAIWRAYLLDYHRLPASQRIAALDQWFGLEPDTPGEEKIGRVLDRMYGSTRLGDSAACVALLDARAEDLEASADPFLQLAVRLFQTDLAQEDRTRQRNEALRALYPRYMAALIDFRESRGASLYPDANGVLRVSFGTVKGYTAADGTRYGAFSKAEEVVAKSRPEEPFHTPPPALQALREKRYGAYRDPGLGTLPVNFLGTVDVTAGSSGAPTLNRRGELLGLVFDINNEGIISSWDYNPVNTRSIHLDIRYILWLLDEVEAGDDLVAEMTQHWKRSREAR